MAHPVRSAHSGEVFFPLDNGAVFMASTTERDCPYVFRVSCDLDAPVNLPALEKALPLVAERFPLFLTKLRAGVFWYYLEPLRDSVRPYADSRFPVEFHRFSRNWRYLFRVRVYGSRISCEVHHILTDGTGAIEFLRSLVATYLAETGVVCEDWEDVRRPGEPVDPAELADSYVDIPKRPVPLPSPISPAFQIPGPRYRPPIYRVTTGTMPLDAALHAAREHKGTLTALLVAAHIAALQDIQDASGARKKWPIRVQVPVNMRKHHPSVSTRNFFLTVHVSIDPRLGHFTFREILDVVQHQLKLELTEKELSRQIWRNVRAEGNLFLRAVPLSVKNPVLRVVGRLVADRPFSGSLSNLQAVSMPEPFAAHIAGFELLPSRKAVVGANIGVMSWNDTLVVTIGSLVEDRSFERLFFIRLTELGIPVSVRSNA